MTTLAIGDTAPVFSLACDDGSTFDLMAERGCYVVLFFYPKDDTEGCTIENRDFSDLGPDFAALGVSVLGISPDTLADHARFRSRHGLTARLAADPEHRAIAAYGVWGDKKMFGRPYKGLIRTTVIVAPDGTVADILAVKRVKGHAAAVLERIRALLASH